jgi:hypothetical protein
MLAGVVVLLACLCLRCLTTMDPAPFWSGDPLVTEAPVLGLTPARSLWLDVVQALAGAVVCVGCMRPSARAGDADARAKRSGVVLFATLALLVGLLAVVRHARASNPESFENAWMGVSWLGGFASALALWLAATCVPRLRGLIAGVLVGLIGAIAVKCVAQVYVEHPQTIATFRLTKDRFFASQGWTPDSPMARAFVRRLEQPEGTAWFGLANPVSTLAAAGLVACVAMLLGAVPRGDGRREHRRAWPLVALTAGAAASLATLVLAGAKGGYAAATLGLFVLAIAWAVRDRARLARVMAMVLGPAVVLAVLSAVAVRGAVGEQLRELSVLFRWMYLEASARIFVEHLPWGAGPAGFKDAYMLTKNPLSPEEIASPHSVLFDLACTLGVAGVLLGAVWMVWAWLAGRTQHASSDDPAPFAFDAPDAKLVGVVFALPTALAGLWEAQAASIGNLLVRMVGLGLAVLVACGVWRLLLAGGHASRWGTWGLCAGAMAIAAQLQIELTGVTPGAAQWTLAMLALAAAGRATPLASRPSVCVQGRWHAIVAGVAAVAMFALAGFGTGHGARQLRWEGALGDAYDACQPARDLQRRLAETEPTSAAMDALLADLASAVGAKPPTRDREEFVDAAMAHVLSRGASDALARLDEACGAAQRASAPTSPTTLHVLRARHRLALTLAQHAGDDATFERHLDRAIAITREHDARFARRSAYWSWRGTASITHRELLRQRVNTTTDRLDQLTSEGVEHFARAAQLAPHELFNWVKLAESAEGTQRGANAAAMALQVDHNLRLDPLERLRPEEASRLREQVEAWKVNRR